MKPWYLLNTGDAVDFVEAQPASSIDLVVTDPAYESLEKHRAIGTTTRLKGAWFPIFENHRWRRLMVSLYRALKPDSHCYVMCDQETAWRVAIAEGKDAGFMFWKAIIWDKVARGMGYHYRAQHELVLFFEKGARQLNDKGIGDVLRFKRVRGAYPTEKPVALSKVLIEQSTEPGAVVLDPFMGSASVGEAALTTGRHFIGNDVLVTCREPAVMRLLNAGGLLAEKRPREDLALT